LIPGLLQTEKYARALLRSVYPEYSERELEQTVDIRMRRQDQLDEPDGPKLIALIDEAALERPIGGTAVMLEQLQHLVTATDRNRTSLQIVPFSAGAHAGLFGSFVLIDPDSSAPNGADTVLFREQQEPSNNLIHDGSDEIAKYEDKWNSASKSALSVEDTITLIEAKIERLPSR
jgi:Domain of unknown function (DUF5753)